MRSRTQQLHMFTHVEICATPCARVYACISLFIYVNNCVSAEVAAMSAQELAFWRQVLAEGQKTGAKETTAGREIMKDARKRVRQLQGEENAEIRELRRRLEEEQDLRQRILEDEAEEAQRRQALERENRELRQENEELSNEVGRLMHIIQDHEDQGCRLPAPPASSL